MKEELANKTSAEELALLERAQKGENTAIEEMLNRYKKQVRGKANTLYLVGADKDDLIQEGMIGLFKAIREFNPEKNESFGAFAQLCITRQMYSAIKASKRKKNQPLNDYVSLYEEEVSFSQNPEESVIDRETTQQLEGMLMERLSKMERQVLSMHTAGYSCQQIAAELCKDPKSIDNALQRLRRKLKTVLAITTRM